MRKVSLLLVLLMVLSVPIFSQAAREDVEDPILIAGIVFQEDQFMRVIQEGMKKAAADYGVQLMLANSDNRLDREIELINTYVSRGVDAIAITPLSETGSVSALRNADNAGITVVTYNSPLAADFPVSYINSSQSELGSSTGEAARRHIEDELSHKDTIKVATLAFQSLLPEISDMRVNSFLNEITGIPGVQIVAQQDAWLAEDAVSRGSDIITANPDLDIIYAANDGGTVGAVQAVRNAGRDDQIKVFGIDASEQLADFLLAPDGVLMATTGQQPFEIGYLSVEFAVKSIRGEAVDPEVIVPGLRLLREDPEGIEQFKVDWAQWTQ